MYCLAYSATAIRKSVFTMLLYCRETGLELRNVSVAEENDNVKLSSLRGKRSIYFSVDIEHYLSLKTSLYRLPNDPIKQWKFFS